MGRLSGAAVAQQAGASSSAPARPHSALTQQHQHQLPPRATRYFRECRAATCIRLAGAPPPPPRASLPLRCLPPVLVHGGAAFPQWPASGHGFSVHHWDCQCNSFQNFQLLAVLGGICLLPAHCDHQACCAPRCQLTGLQMHGLPAHRLAGAPPCCLWQAWPGLLAPS